MPKFKNVTFLNLREEATKVAMLKTGELDLAEVSPDAVKDLKAAGLRVVGHYGASQFFGAIFYDVDNPKKHALGDLRVRKAMSLAINRKELAGKMYGGFAQPSALFYAPLTAYFFDRKALKAGSL